MHFQATLVDTGSGSAVFPKLQGRWLRRGRIPAEQQSQAVEMERKRQRWDRWERREQGLGTHLSKALCPRSPA